MTRPDDSLLNATQLANVQRHVDRLLRDASALNRFPTPIDDIMAAAKLRVVSDEVLNESVLRQFVNKAKWGLATIKSALSKVLGLFESNDRLVLIDRDAPKPKRPFILLHEAGHGTMPHQSKVYDLIHDCDKTLDADITDLFEREANVFASEALFQGEVFSQLAAGMPFGVKTPIALAKKFGASNYAAFRRFVITNPVACCVVVLEPAVLGLNARYSSAVRRVVASNAFDAMYDGRTLCSRVDDAHPLTASVPTYGRRMTAEHDVVLRDRNGDDRICLVEAFNTTHQVLILIRDAGPRRSVGIVVPAAGF